MSTSLPSLDFTYLDQLAMGDPQMRRMFLDLLPDELEDQAGVLQSSLSDGEARRIFEAAHKLRSSLLYTGNEEALDLNAKIEQAAKTGVLTETMRGDGDRLIALIEAMVNLLRGTGESTYSSLKKA